MYVKPGQDHFINGEKKALKVEGSEMSVVVWEGYPYLHPVDMDLGLAIRCLNKGYKIARSDWPKGQYLVGYKKSQLGGGDPKWWIEGVYSFDETTRYTPHLSSQLEWFWDGAMANNWRVVLDEVS